MICGFYFFSINFNSRPSARGDGEQPHSAVLRFISIHAPPRGATSGALFFVPPSYFNSRPSARGDRFCKPLLFTLHLISIHAPPRGATGSRQLDSPAIIISIHAPPRGATSQMPCRGRGCRTFQFTPLREGRREHGQRCAASQCISIHAPPRGATSPSAR